MKAQFVRPQFSCQKRMIGERAIQLLAVAFVIDAFFVFAHITWRQTDQLDPSTSTLTRDQIMLGQRGGLRRFVDTQFQLEWPIRRIVNVANVLRQTDGVFERSAILYSTAH